MRAFAATAPLSIVRVWLGIVLRSTPFWMAMVIRVTLLSLFVVIWGDGVPIGDGSVMHEQFATLDMLMLAILLPWVAIRCGSMTNDEVATFSLVTALAPSRVLAGRWLALWLALAAVVIGAVPVYLLVWLLAALPEGSVASLGATATTLSALAVSLTSLLALRLTHRLAVWLASAAGLLAMVVIAPPAGVVAVAYAVVALALFVTATRLANATAMHADQPWQPSALG